MLFFPSLVILFPLHVVLYVRMENTKQSLCRIINEELKRPLCYSDYTSEHVLTAR